MAALMEPCYAFDMRAVTFVWPYTVMALVNAARLLTHRSKEPGSFKFTL